MWATYESSKPLILSPAPSPAEPPQFVREPERHITAEMEKVVDIPCRAKGNTEACMRVGPSTPLIPAGGSPSPASLSRPHH